MATVKELRNRCHVTWTPVRLAFVINMIFLLLFLCSGTMKYETSDDFMMEVVVSGAYTGDPSPYILFMNPMIGMILSFLYCLSTGINWYFYFQVLIIFSSLWIVTSLVLSKKIDCYSLLISIAFISFFSHDLYQLMQFTKTAAVAIGSGELLLMNHLFAKTSNQKEIALGMLMLGIGIMVRRNCFFIIAVFAIIYGLLWVWKQEKPKKYSLKMILSMLKKPMTLFFLVCAVYGITFAINAIFLSHHVEFGEFKEYQQYRANIIDYGPATYTDMEEELSEIGLSENDYQLLIHYNAGDKNFYHLDMLQRVNEVVENHKQAITVTDLIRSLWDRHYEKYISVWGIAILTLLILMIRSKEEMMILLCHGVITLLLLLYLLFQQRIVYRVEYAIFLACAMNLVLYWIITEYTVKNTNQNHMKIALILLLGLQIPSFLPKHKNGFEAMYESWENHISKYRASFQENRKNELLKEIQDHPNQIYFMGFQTTIQSVYLNYDPRFALQHDQLFNNAAYMGGVIFAHPTHVIWLQQHYLEENLNVLLKEDVYLIENLYQEEFLRFIREHYDESVELEYQKEVDGYQIWKLYSRREESE